MEGERFDRIARATSAHTSRRAIFSVVTSGALALAGLSRSSAGRRKKNVTLCLGGETLSVSKKRKGKYLAQGATEGACAASPPPPPPPPTTTCSDGIQNGKESDVDCGGSCPPCDFEKKCSQHQDCLSWRCDNGTCNSCVDNVDCPCAETGKCECAPNGICV